MKQKQRYRRKTASVRPIGPWDDSRLADLLAMEPRYVGSGEHKQWMPDDYEDVERAALRSDASLCPEGVTRVDAQRILERALRCGSISDDWEGGFPRYAWGRDDQRFYRARLINREQGWYKAHPVEDGEVPEIAQRRLASEGGHRAD